ncbi:hypothetical protein ASF11_16365 [Acidovorax sp. Leaf76]|uniref:hypothetical protein n=1 Tax=unclassified Acidovorax TaxID=2684926 RepID=UPI0006FFAF58|nr:MULTISPECIES: hypothetical protein [unclassified Acidovorax]KQO12584.1 hypothetical protein ASF11_16365 [Acidovorax sp. Leaf76]KQO30192.1 hypothetical protein ASF19_14045 [Acidovorax sp. Leaf84]KQS28738.1 hypothetical protein ASG27_10495 [Acidovorax sp. Leaf191]
MRGLFGLVGLVVVLAIVGIVARKQLSATRAPAAAVQQAPGPGVGASVPVINPTGNVREQSQQVQQQVQQQLDDIMKQRAQSLPEADK